MPSPASSRGCSTNAACARRPARVPRRRAFARRATAGNCTHSRRRCLASTRPSNPSPFPRRTRAPARPPDARRRTAGTPSPAIPPLEGSDDLKKSRTQACQPPQI
ncbi:conserved hypothetical protein [Burkholderia ambifaria]